MLLTQQNILSFIPQRPPFVMVDELLACNSSGTHTSFLVKSDNVLVFNDEFSEAGMAENIAQTAAAGAGYEALHTGGAVTTGYIGAIKNFEVFALPKVGDVLNTTVTVTNNIFEVTIITGKVKCNGALLATCEMKIFIQNQKK